MRLIDFVVEYYSDGGGTLVYNQLNISSRPVIAEMSESMADITGLDIADIISRKSDLWAQLKVYGNYTSIIQRRQRMVFDLLPTTSNIITTHKKSCLQTRLECFYLPIDKFKHHVTILFRFKKEALGMCCLNAAPGKSVVKLYEILPN